jgi:hypothetical protein
VVRVLIALLLIAVAFPFMRFLEKAKPGYSEAPEVVPYSYPRLILSFPSLKAPVADFLYMKLCYLAGNDVFNKWKERKFTKEEWKTILHNVKVITRLDPYYFDVYYFTGAYAPWRLKKYPDLLEELNSILLFGMERLKDWRLPFFVGFNYFYFLKDKEKGAYYLRLASKMEGAPSYLKLLVPRLYAESGKYDVAIVATVEELKGAKSEVVKKSLEKRLRALVALRDLNRALERYRRFYGKCPESLEELVEKGFIEKLPREPYGGRFFITKDCKVWTTSNLRPVKSNLSSR